MRVQGARLALGRLEYNKTPRDIHVLCKFKMLWLARANPGVAQPAITGCGHGADDDDGAATDDAGRGRWVARGRSSSS